VELGVLRQQPKLVVQNLQALFRNRPRSNVIDADLQVIKACAVERADPRRRQQVPVRDQSREQTAAPYAVDDFVQVRLQQRLPPLIVTMLVPSAARRSTRSISDSSGTGGET